MPSVSVLPLAPMVRVLEGIGYAGILLLPGHLLEEAQGIELLAQNARRSRRSAGHLHVDVHAVGRGNAVG